MLIVFSFTISYRKFVSMKLIIHLNLHEISYLFHYHGLKLECQVEETFSGKALRKTFRPKAKRSITSSIQYNLQFRNQSESRITSVKHLSLLPFTYQKGREAESNVNKSTRQIPCLFHYMLQMQLNELLCSFL